MLKHRVIGWTFVGFAGLLILSCTSSQKAEEGQMTFQHVLTEERFEDAIERNTRTARKYDGLVNNYEFSATLHSTEVIDGLSWKRAIDFQWTQDKYIEERKKLEQLANTKTQLFLSFFTPYTDSDNLHTGKSMWKIYLEVAGTRYEGQVEKLSESLLQLNSLYRHHTRFNTPYLITFNVPTLVAQQGKAKLTVTSPVGSSDLTY